MGKATVNVGSIISLRHERGTLHFADGIDRRFRYNAAMEVIALQSGSSGNCIYVEADGVRLLFDAGISGCQAERRHVPAGRSSLKPRT